VVKIHTLDNNLHYKLYIKTLTTTIYNPTTSISPKGETNYKF